MNTNKTIDDVPRELLEKLHSCARGLEASEWAELRALLDAPTCKTCGDAGWVPEPFSIRENMLECPDCKPVAQGEPVAWQYRVSAGPQTGWSLWHDGKGEEFKQSYQVETRPLYAEQPAPVAHKYDDTLLPFLALMRKELHANSHKGDREGWLGMTPNQALSEVLHHVKKLEKAEGNAQAIEYAADVANCCMMLLDVCGLLTNKPE